LEPNFNVACCRTLATCSNPSTSYGRSTEGNKYWGGWNLNEFVTSCESKVLKLEAYLLPVGGGSASFKLCNKCLKTK
jgi:hypothetical protein